MGVSGLGWSPGRRAGPPGRAECCIHRASRSGFTRTGSCAPATPVPSGTSSRACRGTWTAPWSATPRSARPRASSSSRVRATGWDGAGQGRAGPLGAARTRATVLTVPPPAGSDVYWYDLSAGQLKQRAWTQVGNCSAALRWLERYYCFQGLNFLRFNPVSGDVPAHRYPLDSRDYFICCPGRGEARVPALQIPRCPQSPRSPCTMALPVSPYHSPPGLAPQIMLLGEPQHPQTTPRAQPQSTPPRRHPGPCYPHSSETPPSPQDSPMPCSPRHPAISGSCPATCPCRDPANAICLQATGTRRTTTPRSTPPWTAAAGCPCRPSPPTTRAGSTPFAVSGAGGKGPGAAAEPVPGHGGCTPAAPGATRVPTEGYYFRLDSRRDGWHAWPLSHRWAGLEGEVDATFMWENFMYVIQVRPVWR